MQADAFKLKLYLEESSIKIYKPSELNYRYKAIPIQMMLLVIPTVADPRTTNRLHELVLWSVL